MEIIEVTYRKPEKRFTIPYVGRIYPTKLEDVLAYRSLYASTLSYQSPHTPTSTSGTELYYTINYGNS